MTVRTFLIDLIFPPTPQERRVRLLSEAKLQSLRSIPHAREIQTLFPYRHPDIEALLWQLKYRGDRKAVRLLASALRDVLTETFSSPHLVIPMPLAQKRERERGFNQVALVLEEAVRDLPHLTTDAYALTRIRHTKPQTSLTRYERLKNLHGAFAVTDPSRVAGKAIVLIDDVTTTGATFREAKETLLAAGAQSVTCIALAH